MCHATVLFFTLSVVSLGYYELVICILLYPSYLLDKIRQANDPMLWICLCFCSLFFLLLFCSYRRMIERDSGRIRGMDNSLNRERESEPSRPVVLWPATDCTGLGWGLVMWFNPSVVTNFRKHGTKNLTRWGCRWDCRWGWRKVHASSTTQSHFNNYFCGTGKFKTLLRLNTRDQL